MSEIVIRTQGLSKAYQIGHQADAEAYVTLRDVVVASIKRLSQSAVGFVRPSGVISGNTIEEFWALKDVNFDVARGEVVGIIGRNGAGKSTLLKVLSRITEPSAGRVEIKGRVASLLEVGTGFHPELTGRENIYLNGAILGMTRAEIRRKFDEIVAFAEVDKFLDTPVKRYSSGMYVRLAFAVAAHLEPEILIVDEVLAVGDATFQRKCLGKIKDVAAHGRTVLFVSHNLEAISRLCTRGLLLAGGKIVADGSVETVIEYYGSKESITYSVSFPAKPNHISITGIKIDREALRARHLMVDIEIASSSPLPSVIGAGVVLQTVQGSVIWEARRSVYPRSDTVAAVIRCESHDLPIIPGKYLFSAWLASWHEYYDRKLDALTISLGEFDESPVNGHLDWPADWDLRP
jgi:lipopolysaccharide transport system ATP-binding protein